MYLYICSIQIYIYLYENNNNIYIYTCSLGIDTYVFLFFFECHPPQKKSRHFWDWNVLANQIPLRELSGGGYTIYPNDAICGTSSWLSTKDKKHIATAMFEASTKKRGHSIAVFVMLPRINHDLNPPPKHTKNTASRHRLGRSMFWVAYRTLCDPSS